MFAAIRDIVSLLNVEDWLAVEFDDAFAADG